MLKKLLGTVIFCLCFLLSFSQNKPLTGIVKDADTGEPLIGVSILLKGTTAGTATDINGKFTINVPANDAQLVFKYIGYQELTLTATQSPLDVKLKAVGKNLNEVVVVGYGTIKKSNVTGAQSQVNSSQIEDRPIARVDQALAGQVAGVQVKAVTGTPGQALQIRVRGGASVSASNEPLYVIDGVPISDLGNINPEDIESITSLKTLPRPLFMVRVGLTGWY